MPQQPTHKNSVPSDPDLLQIGIDLYGILDEIPMAVAILDIRHRIAFLNRTMEALTGYSRLDVMGIPCHQVIRSRACIEGCPLKKGPVNQGQIRFESDLIDGNRRLIPIRTTLAPLYNAAGRHVGYLKTVEDASLPAESGLSAGIAFSFQKIIGKSPQMERLFQILPVIAQSGSSVLITGETGTGKDLLAESIHQNSDRAKGPFIKINCGALPETLLESELFGHEKGAFTGAVEKKPGRFHLAHNGTLYLTEIGDLPLPLQVKLLTFLDDRVVYPLGSTKGFEADVRIVAATHRDLEQMVREGKFRQDLYFRLNVVRVHIPPLREREGDIGLLLGHFINSLSESLGRKITGLAKDAQRILEHYPYPGNVRELINIVEYAANVCDGDRIRKYHLPGYLNAAEQMSGTGPDSPPSKRLIEEPVVTGQLEKDPSWSTLEKKMVLEALVRSAGNKEKAADLLGWSRTKLWRKRKQYGIDP